MSFLRRLFGNGGEGPGAADGPVDDAEWRRAADATFEAHADKHRVTIWLRLYDPSFESMREQQRVFALENRIMRTLDEAGAGEHDTNSLERGYLALRLVGEDAEAMVAVVLPLLAEAPDGSYLAVRRGPAGTGEERIEVGSGADDATDVRSDG
ncbi:MAG TPA: hypothetical protein VK987_09645 [Anaerolineae bacterium]|nr:hypothetical protein [Anaerolineae bacterium]